MTSAKGAGRGRVRGGGLTNVTVTNPVCVTCTRYKNAPPQRDRVLQTYAVGQITLGQCSYTGMLNGEQKGARFHMHCVAGHPCLFHCTPPFELSPPVKRVKLYRKQLSVNRGLSSTNRGVSLTSVSASSTSRGQSPTSKSPSPTTAVV